MLDINLKYYFTLCLFLLTASSLIGQKSETLPEDSLVLYKIAYIDISGNEKTKQKIVERELNFRVGEEYTYKDLEKLTKETYKNLIKLPLFNYVTIEKKILDYDRVGISINVEERWFVWPQFSIINNDRNFNTWWETKDLSRLDYRIAVKQNNVFGLNHTLKLELSYGYTRDFSLSYKNISLGKLQKHFLGCRVHYFRQHSIFYKSIDNKSKVFDISDNYVIRGVNGSINYSFRPKHKSTHSISVSYNDIEISDTLFNSRNDFLAGNNKRNKYLKFVYNYTLDNRDNSSYPLSGNRLRFSFVKRGFNLSKKYPVNLMYVHTSFNQFYKIVNRLYAAHSLSVKKSLQSKTPYYYKRGLGYYDYLRGFEYYVIEAEDLMLVKNTLNFELLPRIITNLNFIPIKKFKKIHYSIYINTFFDFAWSHENDEEVVAHNNLTNSLLYSGGLGINLVTYYDKVLRIEYSLNSLGEGAVFIHFKASI